MDSTSKQWRSLGEPASPAEAEALSAVRAVLPDDAVTHAWVNLSFLDSQGRTAEVDALLLTRVGLFVVELKGWHGTIAGDQQNWRITAPGGQVRHTRNPLFATDFKAKRLRSVLESAAPNPQARRDIPFVGALVVLHGRDSTVTLPEPAQAGLLTLDGYGVKGLPISLSQFLATPPDHGQVIDGPRAKRIRQAIERAGFVPTPKTRTVGQYALEKADPIGAGPTWQDVLATHPAMPSVRRRLRLFDVPPGATAEARREIETAARREYLFTQGMQHHGIAAPRELVATDSGPALVFDYDDAEVPLDEFVTSAGPTMGLGARLELIRQLAEVLQYAHQRRLVHRGLTPAKVMVTSGGGPTSVVIRDWQTGRRTEGSSAAPPQSTTSFGAVDVRALVGHADWPYLAPEAHIGAPELPPVPLDVYGLGALSYLILTGQPPAASLAELQSRLESQGCLDPRAADPAVADSLADLVRRATQRIESDRTASIQEFLAHLDAVEDELTTPDPDTPEQDRPRAADPLTAARGEIIGDRFEVLERRGSGSTGTALLVDDYTRERTGVILKLARDDAAARRLQDEAEVLERLTPHPRLVALLEPPLTVDGRRGLLLSDAGKSTLASWLESNGRATIQELERFGADLLEAVAALDGQGVFHRDIKPANLGILPDPSTRKPRLVLLDFSLSREAPENLSSGTRGYLDPFIALSTTVKGRARRRYDRAAELYAVAVTLFEMATTELPWWRDGEYSPASMMDAPVMDAGTFEASVGESLLRFFSSALAGEVSDRFQDVAAMAAAWRNVFRTVDTEQSLASDDADRDRAADAATLDTPLADAGLSARALSGLARVPARTVGELVRTSPMVVNSIPGLGEQYRKEVQRRVRQWRHRLLPAAPDQPTTGEDQSVESYLDRLVPRLTSTNGTEVATLRLLLGLPVDTAPPGLSAWPTATELAGHVGVTRPRVSQILDAAAERWVRSRRLGQVHAEVLEILAAEAGVATLDEVARALLARHGSAAEGTDRRRLAAGLVRAVVERDNRSDEPRLQVRRQATGPVLIASSETTPTERLLEDAQRLAEQATALVSHQSVVPAAQAREALRALRLRGAYTDDRVLRLAAAASAAVSLSSLHELHRSDLDLSRATEIALRGVSVTTLSADGARRRVANRFPALPPLPVRPALDALVEAAVPGLRWDGTAYARASATASSAASRTAFTRFQAEPLETVDGYLRASLERRSPLTLCAHPRQYAPAIAALTHRYGVRAVDLSRLLLSAVRQTAARDEVSWELVLRADAETSGGDWANLRSLVEDAFADPWAELSATAEPLLLTNPGVIARYGLTPLLSELLDLARPRPAARWILIPRRGSQAVPLLDGQPGSLGADRWIDLPADLLQTGAIA